MASITPPPPPHNFRLRSLKRPSCPPSFPRFADSTTPHRCRCAHPSSSSDNTAGGWRWDAALNDAVQSAMRRLDRLVNLPRKKKADAAARDEEVEEAGKGEEWDWERWKRHFVEVDDQERLVCLLKSQLGHAIRREDYEDAARLKVAIAAAATNDTVGEVMSQLSRAIAEERYWEAAFLRDNAGAGLVGWWSGISKDAHDPYGLIVRITAEHGRYVARSYNPGKLGAASTGTPLFEIFLTINKKSEYRQQAVYLRRKVFQDPQNGSSKATDAGGRLNPSGPPEEKGDIVVASTDDSEDTDDEEDSSDVAELLPGLPNILQDMIPGEKVKVLKVTAPAKDDRDFLSKVIEQILDEEDKDQDMELEISEDENQGENDEDSDDHGRDNQERDDADFISGPAVVYSDDKREISVEVFVGGLGQKVSGSLYESLRVPAKLEKKGRKSFSFSVEKDNNQVDLDKKKSPSIGGKAKLVGQGSIENVMLDLAKVIGKDKIPSKVLRDIIELIDHSISRAQNNQQLSGTTTFHRIELSSSPDPLSGLYLGAQGLHSSEIISLQRKFGQWHDNGTKETANLEFYEYVEAVKLTGDPYVPAGQVAFRAKVGKRYQLPHKGIIPEELGVIARYKGQGRLAEPGFQNPRWVDGELVILDGKFIKGVGFVYWAPKYQYLVFFNRLRLQ